MSFLAPFMLLGAAAGGIPIALHFFFRSRYRTVPWAAMKFLLTSIEQTSRRLKFQELLLLIVRVVVLVLLAFALARPFTRTTALAGGGSRGDSVDAAFLIDTSYSMTAADGPVSRLERAKTAALAVIDHLPRNSTVQIVGAADRAMPLGPRTPSHLGQARQIIQSLEATSLTTDLLAGVNEAAAALRRGPSPNKELYVFSDMQVRGFEQQGAGIKVALQTLSQSATIYLVRCGTRPVKNAAVVAIVPQSGIPHTGERVGFAVLVRNSGKEPIRDLNLTLEVDGLSQERDAQPIPLLNPGETRAVSLTAKLDQAGLRTVSAQLKEDDLPADNRFDQVLNVHEQVRALVIDGAPGDRDPDKAATYYLLHTLRPVPEPAWGKYHLQPRVVTPAQAVPALLADKDVCILVNVPLEGGRGEEGGTLTTEFIDRLADFVKEGHGLMIFAGSKVSPGAYNRLLHERHGLLPHRFKGAVTAPPDRPWRLEPASADAQGYLASFREEPLDRIRLAEVDRVMDVEDDPPAETKPARDPTRVLLQYSNGRPAVAARRFGDGEVLLVTTSADQSWTNWPLLPTFLPFMHVSVGHLLHEQIQNHNRVAGEPLRWYPPTREGLRAYALSRPGKDLRRLGPADTTGGRPTVAVTDTFQAGIYRLVAGAPVSPGSGSLARDDDAAGVPFAVVPDTRESENLDVLNDAQLDERLGFKPVHLIAGDDADVFAGSERLNWEWTKWLLMALLALALFETGLAWFCSRGW